MIFVPDKQMELRMIRGSTMTLEIEVSAPDGQPYVLLEGDVIRFGVKHGDCTGAYKILKETKVLNQGVGSVEILPEDTLSMVPGRYAYDVGLQSGEKYFPIVSYSDFILEPNVTERV